MLVFLMAVLKLVLDDQKYMSFQLQYKHYRKLQYKRSECRSMVRCVCICELLYYFLEGKGKRKLLLDRLHCIKSILCCFNVRCGTSKIIIDACADSIHVKNISHSAR